MQQYPYITELFACTQIMLAIMFLYKFINLFRDMFNTKTIEINSFTSVTK